jgi:hypothetical protein
VREDVLKSQVVLARRKSMTIKHDVCRSDLHTVDFTPTFRKGKCVTFLTGMGKVIGVARLGTNMTDLG